jgi:hypothetical protein
MPIPDREAEKGSALIFLDWFTCVYTTYGLLKKGMDATCDLLGRLLGGEWPANAVELSANAWDRFSR